jgi:DNA-binding phage protein
MNRARTGAERYIAELKKDPEFRAAYEDAARRTRAVDELVRSLERARLRLGLSKAELARRAGMQPEAVRRLFSVDRPNPTAVTLTALAQVLGLELVARPVPTPNHRRPANRPAAT